MPGLRKSPARSWEAAICMAIDSSSTVPAGPGRFKVVVATVRHDPQDDRIYFKEALSLAKRLDVVLIAPDRGAALVWDPRVKFRPIPRRSGLLGRGWSLVEAVRGICRENPDVCHVHDLELAPMLPFLRLFTRARIIYDSHEVFTRQDIRLRLRQMPRLGPLLGWLVEKAENLLVRCCHQIITAVDPEPSALGGGRVPQHTIFNYPPLAVFEASAGALDLVRQRHAGRLPVIYQGTMSPERGLFAMLEAVARIKRDEPRIFLKLIGMTPGALQQQAETRIRELNLTADVELSGWRPHAEVAAEMRASLIGLVPLLPNPKYDRALPIKLLEYMACGLPVVAADLPLQARYVRECAGGRIYDSRRPDELARAILELLRDPAQRQQMGANGLRAVRERWNWDQMERELFQIYDSLTCNRVEARA